MRVHDKLSEEFGVSIGLKQGCALSTSLFLLLINGVVTGMHEGRCGV